MGLASQMRGDLTNARQFFFLNLIFPFVPLGSRPESPASRSRPASASPTPGSRPEGADSPVRKPPTFKTAAAAVRTSGALQQGRKSPAQRGNLGSTGYVKLSQADV